MRNERITELDGGKKEINKSTLRWFGHVERMDDSRLVRRMYSGECVGNRLAERTKKKWIESAKIFFEGCDISFAWARRKLHNRSEWQYFVRVYGCGPPEPG